MNYEVVFLAATGVLRFYLIYLYFNLYVAWFGCGNPRPTSQEQIHPINTEEPKLNHEIKMLTV